MNDERYPCPCCGYRTFALAYGWTTQTCPVCMWTDVPGDYPDNKGVPVAEGQNNFLTIGAFAPASREAARPPLSEEARSPHWLSFEESRAKVVALVEQAFADTIREDGITLHQMDVLDGYGGEARLAAAAAEDPELRWQDVASSKLDRFSMSMTFLDAKGFRFYLPAFMRLALQSWRPECGTTDACGVFWALHDGLQGFHRPAFELLTLPQKEAVSAFVWFHAHCDPSYVEEAFESLSQGWDAHVPEFLPLSIQ